MKKFPLGPVVIAGAAVMGLLFVAKTSGAKDQEHLPPPLPKPAPPPPQPMPGPNDPFALLALLTNFAKMAQVDPNSVDPNQVDTLASQFDAAGLPLQAQQARALAQQIRLGRAKGQG